MSKPNAKRKPRRKPAKKKKARKKPGRPEIKIDLKLLEVLCGLQCTDEEIADGLGISVDTIGRRKKDEKGDFCGVYKKAKSLGKISLRRKLWRHADKSPAAAIFLAKNLLGYQDNPEAARPVDTPERFVPMPDGSFRRIAEGESQIGQFDEPVDTPKP